MTENQPDFDPNENSLRRAILRQLQILSESYWKYGEAEPETKAAFEEVTRLVEQVPLVFEAR